MSTTHATAVGTSTYADQFPILQYSTLGKTNLMVSMAGFGCYRIDPQQHEHQQALLQALSNGINLIDTSTNYGNGYSESMVGHALQMQFATGKISREQVVVVSKVGYLQGSNYSEGQERKAAGAGWPELVEYSDGLEHCIHPDFIHEQLSHSTSRLQIDCLDVCLLHNPEYYLGWAEKHGVTLETARETYYDRIRRAFIQLEEEVIDGKIQYYGVSSNTFVESAENPQFTSLTTLWKIAQSISPTHHFRIIQMPFNLRETGAATESNQPNGQSILDFAHEKGLAVLINRPLNAVVGNQLVRLADTPDFGTATHEEVEHLIDKMITLEGDFSQHIAPMLEHSAEIKRQLEQYLAAGHILRDNWFALGSYHQWQQTVTSYLLPRLNAARNFLAKPDNLPAKHVNWLTNYVETTNNAFRAIGAVYSGVAAQRTQVLRQQVESAEPSWLADTLSQTAIRALRSTTGVSSVLVGMRHPNYVSDVINELTYQGTQTPHSEAWQQMASH